MFNGIDTLIEAVVVKVQLTIISSGYVNAVVLVEAAAVVRGVKPNLLLLW